jgi:hypothetical protein
MVELMKKSAVSYLNFNEIQYLGGTVAEMVKTIGSEQIDLISRFLKTSILSFGVAFREAAGSSAAESAQLVDLLVRVSGSAEYSAGTTTSQMP